MQSNIYGYFMGRSIHGYYYFTIEEGKYIMDDFGTLIRID